MPKPGGVYDADDVQMPAVRPRQTAPPPISRLARQKIIAFGWYGGNYSHLEPRLFERRTRSYKEL